MEPDDQRMPTDRRGPLEADEVTFLICVEGNRLEPQALLLCESIRRFGGRYRAAPIVAVSPRPHLTPRSAVRAALADLGVTLVVEALNTTGSTYGTINRVVAGAWAETQVTTPYLAVLDTDTVFVAAPTFARHDAGARPIDVKGIASSGPGDPFEAYWAAICGFGGLTPDDLPMVTATVDGATVRAAYNGGFTVVRRDRGMLAATADVFFSAFTRGLRPRTTPAADVRASTGFVPADARPWWGSSQAALSAGIWSRTRDVVVYDRAYNIPAHSLAERAVAARMAPVTSPVLLHYHYLADPRCQPLLRGVMRRLSCTEEACALVDQRLALFSDAATISTR